MKQKGKNEFSIVMGDCNALVGEGNYEGKFGNQDWEKEIKEDKDW